MLLAHCFKSRLPKYPTRRSSSLQAATAGLFPKRWSGDAECGSRSAQAGRTSRCTCIELAAERRGGDTHLFGANFLGAVYVPVNTAYRGRLLEHVIALSDAKVLVADLNYLPRLQNIDTAALSRCRRHRGANGTAFRVVISFGRGAFPDDPRGRRMPDRTLGHQLSDLHIGNHRPFESGLLHLPTGLVRRGRGHVLLRFGATGCWRICRCFMSAVPAPSWIGLSRAEPACSSTASARARSGTWCAGMKLPAPASSAQ